MRARGKNHQHQFSSVEGDVVIDQSSIQNRQQRWSHEEGGEEEEDTYDEDDGQQQQQLMGQRRRRPLGLPLPRRPKTTTNNTSNKTSSIVGTQTYYSNYQQNHHTPSMVQKRRRRGRPKRRTTSGLITDETTVMQLITIWCSSIVESVQRLFQHPTENTSNASTTTTTTATTTTTNKQIGSISNVELFVAVVLWYTLGVISISTSKVLLTPPSSSTTTAAEDSNHSTKDMLLLHVGGVPPLVLTLQQLLLGSTYLRWLISIKFLNCHGLVSWNVLKGKRKKYGEKVDDDDYEYDYESQNHNDHRNDDATMLSGTIGNNGDSWKDVFVSLMENLSTLFQGNKAPHRYSSSASSSSSSSSSASSSASLKYLIWSGSCFTLGFLATNMGFGTSSAAFVETIKAAEPITSAALAVSYGLEILSTYETASLGGIIVGVLCSTLGNVHPTASSPTTTTTTDSSSSSALMASLISCTIVMTANLCFSLRGLYQKLFRKAMSTTTKGTTTTTSMTMTSTTTTSSSSPSITSTSSMDDINLQFRMQQIGVCLLLFPTILWNSIGLLRYWYHIIFSSSTLTYYDILYLIYRYVRLSIINGLAFSSYNLASTYILSRISVIYHAVLNCIRRIFAIVVTSIVFSISMTYMGIGGIMMSIIGFISFTYAKTNKNTKTPKKTTTKFSKHPKATSIKK